jgi:hypothetical protein
LPAFELPAKNLLFGTMEASERRSAGTNSEIRNIPEETMSANESGNALLSGLDRSESQTLRSVAHDVALGRGELISEAGQAAHYVYFPTEGVLSLVGTTTGGTKEILKDGETGFTFAPEDADGLAEQVTRLIIDPDLCWRLARAGRQTVLENFTLDKMVDEIEEYLVGCFVTGENFDSVISQNPR